MRLAAKKEFAKLRRIFYAAYGAEWRKHYIELLDRRIAELQEKLREHTAS